MVAGVLQLSAVWSAPAFLKLRIMNIMDHLIRDTDIIGIGPLYYQFSKDQLMRSLHNSFRYEFYIHTRQLSILIVSDYLKPSDLDEEQKKKETEKAHKWEDEYYKIRKLVAHQIGEIIPEQQ